jgi:hypothetical protein
MQNKSVRFGPVALTTTLTTNVLNPGTTTGGTGMPSNSNNLYFLIKHIRIVNKTGNAATFSLWIGATGANAAGTEFMGTTLSVAANSYVDWYGQIRLDASDFLVGGSNTAAALTFQAEGEVGVN